MLYILLFLIVILPAQAVYAGSEERLNNLVGPKEQYNNMLIARLSGCIGKAIASKRRAFTSTDHWHCQEEMG